MPVRFEEKVSMLLMGAAEPKMRAAAIDRVRGPLHQELKDQFSHVLSIAPTIHFFPVMPNQGKEQDAENELKQASATLGGLNGVHGTFLYRLVTHQGKQDAPLFLLVAVCENNGVLAKVKTDPKIAKHQQALAAISRGNSVSESGEIGVSSLLFGVT